MKKTKQYRGPIMAAIHETAEDLQSAGLMDKRTMRKFDEAWGTTLDEFLDAEGIRETAKAEAVTRVVAWLLTQEMERQGITKATLAEKMHTSRAQVDRILKAKGNITIETLQRAAALVGHELRLKPV